MANTATDLYLKKLRQKYKEKGATEQEAETMASQDQAQQEAQQTQQTQQSKYDTLNGWQKFGAGVEEFVDNMAQTFLDLGEGLVDSVAIGVGSIAEGIGDKNTANSIRGFVERDWTDELVNQGNAFGTGADVWRVLNFPSEVLWGNGAREASRQEDLLPDVVDSISSGIGSSLGMGALSSIPYVGWVLTGMAAGGASAEQELKNNPDIDISSAMGYGIINGSVEVASELLVGKALGLIGKGFNKVVGGSAVSETATRFGLGSSTGGNIVTNLLKEFNEEGIEEVVSEFVDPIARKLTIEKDKPIGDELGETWGNAEWWINDVWTAYWQGGLSSVVMGGAGATANTIKAGGVKNYNAILQVKQVAEINEQIKELEAKNTNGMYDSKIKALNAQKQNVIFNFQTNFEQFAKDYLKEQNGDNLTKKEERRASIYDSLEYESNRDVRRELAAETAFKAGAFDVTFDKDGKPSYAIKKDNFINYDGKQLSAKDLVTSVIHEIGHINVNDFSFVDSILQDVSAQELQKLENEYTERYKRAYTATSVMASDYYKEEIKNGATQEQAIENARKKMIKEEIAMDRFASYFDNIDEFKRAINGKKLSLLERLKERFMNTYKHVEKAQKPKNYDSIIKALREAVEQTKERRVKLFRDSMNENVEESTEPKDIRYRITDTNWDEIEKANKPEYTERYGKDIDFRYAFSIVDPFRENLQKIDKSGSFDDLEKAPKANMAIKFLEASRDFAETLDQERDNAKEDFEEAIKNNDLEAAEEAYNHYYTLSKIGEDFAEEYQSYYDEVDREGDYDNYTDKIAESNEARIEKADDIVSEIDDYNVEEFEDLEDFKERLEELKNGSKKSVESKKTEVKEESKPLNGEDYTDQSPLSEKQIAQLTKIRNSSKLNQLRIDATNLNMEQNVTVLKMISEKLVKIEDIKKGEYKQILHFLNAIDNEIQMAKEKSQTTSNEEKVENVENAQEQTTTEETTSSIKPTTRAYLVKQATAFLKTVDETRVDELNAIIKQMNETTSLDELKKLNDEVEKMKQEQKEKTNEQNTNGLNETGTGTVRQGDERANSEVSLQRENGDNASEVEGRNAGVGEQVGVEPGTSVGLHRGSRDRNGISDAKNKYDSEFRKHSRAGRGRDRISNLYRYGKTLRENKEITTYPRSLNGSIYNVVKDEYLPKYLLDMKNEFKKLKIGDDNLDFYFYVADAKVTKNGFTSETNFIAVRIDSNAQNTATHELSHVLSKLNSKSFLKANTMLFNEYFLLHKEEYDTFIEKIKGIYETKYQKQFAKKDYGTTYENLDKDAKVDVDKKVSKLCDEELFCAIIQGKVKIKDRQFHKKLIDNYLDDIKTEHGLDLEKYYYSDFIDIDEVTVQPKDINLDNYVPIETVAPTKENKTKSLQLYSNYISYAATQVEQFINAVNDLNNLTDVDRIIPTYNKLEEQRANAKNLLKDLKGFNTEWEFYYEKEIAPLKERLNKIIDDFNKCSDKFSKTKNHPSLLTILTKKVDIINVQGKYRAEKKELLKLLAKNRFANNEEFSQRAQNLAELIETRYSDAIDNVDKIGYNDIFYNDFQQRIDIIWNDYMARSERNAEIVKNGSFDELKKAQQEKDIKKRLNRGDLTYDKKDEAKRLNELKEQVKPKLQEIKKISSQYNTLIKSQKSRYINYNWGKDTSSKDASSKTLGKRAKLNLHENITKYIDDLTTKINEYRELVQELTKGETFRREEFYSAMYETITSLENDIGTTFDSTPETLYGLKNILYLDAVKNDNTAKEYAEKLNKQNAEAKKDVKDAIKDIERNIPNEANDLIDELEDLKEKYQELLNDSQDQIEINNELKQQIADLEEKIEKIKIQKDKQIKSKQNSVEYWKAKYANGTATIKDLKQERDKYKKELLESQKEINLKQEVNDFDKKYSKLEKELREQKELNENVKRELKEKKAEYNKKVAESKTLTKKIVELRKKLFFEKVNNKSMLKVDNNFIEFMNEFVKAFQQDIKYTDDFFDRNTLQKLALAVTENNSQAFADALITGLEAKGFDKELLALENGEHLYYESNFSDLVELAFIELNNYQNSEFTNLGKLMVRLENAKTDYKLLQEKYNANFRIRTAATSVKSFNKFFSENTKNISSRLHGVDTVYREALVKFVKELQDYTSIEAVASGAVRRKILDFYKELRMSYEKDIEVNGIALDDGLISIFEQLKKFEAEYQEYIQDLENSSLSATESATSEEEVKKAKPKNSYKISEEEAKLYRSLFKGLKRFTDDVMHNRYWEIGDFNGTGTEFTEKIVNETRDLKYVIKHLRWNPLTKMYMSPRNIFREISGYKENAMIMEMFKELEKGTIRTMEAKMALAKPLQEFFKKNKKFEKELQKDSEKYRHTIKYGDKSISASTTLLLDLYEAMQNENNKKHLMNDGFELGDAKPKRFEDGELKQLEEAIVNEFKLNDENSIYSQYIKLLNNMYELAKKYKIETDIRMRGFTNVDDGFYYPTSVSDFNLDIDLSKSAYNLGNSYGGVDLVTNQRSFNIDRTSTRGAIRIVNSYDKMLQHINGMASYYGVDSSILNFSKMYRYRVEGGISGGNAIRQLYGQDYRKFDRYLGELFKDMRGTNTPTTGTDSFFKKVESFVRGGVVTATLVNPKVIATQPASLLTAFKYINPKHILSSLHRGFVLTSKYPPLPTVGAYRYFDQSALQAETGGVSGIQKQIGKGISAGDHFAINIEWAACCKQVGLLQFEKGTAQYQEALQKATELFTRVVNDTQPNNSPLGKAEIMRSDNEIIKLLTMYRSQAMQNFNILYDSINQLRMLSKMAKAQHLSYQETKVMLAKPKKDLARALASLILEGALFTFIGQLFAHFVNNDWDEEDFWANAARDFSVEYFNDNVLGIMPVLNKLSLEYEKELSISMNNITMGWVESVIESLQKMSDGASPKEFIKVISYGTGIPISTNYKYTKAIIQYISPEFATEFDAIYNGTNTRSKNAINYALNDNQSAKAYELYKKYTSYSMEFDMQTTKELFDLYKDGYTDTAVKQIPSSISYNEQKIKVDEKQFKDIYSKVAKHINSLTKSSAYKKMSKVERAETIKYLLNMYYSIAKKNITGQELSFIERVLLYNTNLNVDKILLIKSIKDIEADKKLSKKEKTQLYIDKLKTPKAYKYFLYMASGYSLNDEQKKLVKGYLINNGLSWKKATEVLQ